LLSDYGIEKCYAGWQDPTQHPAEDYPFNLKITDRADIFNTCRDIAASFLPQAMVEAYTGPPMKFLRPGELSGSYSPQQMQAMGFKQSSNGSWYIPMNMWQRLVSGGQIRENFADGKNPQDKGDAKRHGINTRASVSSLRKTAKSGGRKGQLAHWLANMKAGRAKKKKTNEAVDQQTVANFTDRVTAAVEMIAQKAEPNYQKIIRMIPVNITNGSVKHKAMASGDDLFIDADEFHDAPADILMFVLAHEMAHIIFDHSWVRDPKAPPLTVQQEQQQELDADKWALGIMKKIGISKIKVWTWLRRKKDDLEAYKRRQEAAAPLGHPTFNQRTNQARRMGVELTKINTDQIDYAIQQLQHMA